MERKSILKERVAYEAVVAFIHKCTELGITEEQTMKIHREVEGLIKAGIEIGRKENTTAEDSDVNLNDEEIIELLFPLVKDISKYLISLIFDFSESLSSDQIQELKKDLGIDLD